MFKETLRVFLIITVSMLSILSFASAQEQVKKSFSYENEELGVKITCPENWFMISGEQAEKAVSSVARDINELESIKEARKRLGILVTFSKYPLGSAIEFNPNIALTTEPLNADYNLKTAVDCANASVITGRMMLKDFKLITDIFTVIFGGGQGAHYVYQATMTRGYLQLKFKSSVYMFVKGNMLYTLSFTDKSEEFDNDLKAFETTVNSFIVK